MTPTQFIAILKAASAEELAEIRRLLALPPNQPSRDASGHEWEDWANEWGHRK